MTTLLIRNCKVLHISADAKAGVLHNHDILVRGSKIALDGWG